MALLFYLLSLQATSAFSYVATYPEVTPFGETSNETTIPIYFALIMSFGGAFNSSGTIPGVQIALDLINARPNLLPGYSLHYTATDSQCNRTVALSAFYHQILHEPTKLAVVGAGCSVATEPTAEISHFYNITQISCASSSSELADRTKFPAYFQMLPTEIDLTAGYAAIARQYGWRHMTIIQQEENLFSRTVERLDELFQEDNITSTTKVFESKQGVSSIQDQLFDRDEESRIYYLAMYSSQAKIVLCKAAKSGIRAPRYVFLTYAWYTNNWWVPEPGDGVNCTREEQESALKHTLAVTQYPEIMDPNQVTDQEITHDEYVKLYQERLEKTGYSYVVNAEQCFDGIWSLAMAINETLTELSIDPEFHARAASAEGLNSSNFHLEDFTYENRAVREKMFEHLSRTRFLGVTGPVGFTEQGIRTVSRLRVLQYRSNSKGSLELVEVASVLGTKAESEFVYAQGESNSTVWPDGIPYDGVAEKVIVSVSPALTGVYAIITACGIGFTIVCLIFNILFRNKKLIRLSSPTLNYFIVGGALIMYTSVLFYIMPTYTKDATTAVCNIGPRLFALGYSLCFGTVLAKMWRVYYIFTNPSPKLKAIRDWQLMVLIAVIVCVDFVLLGVLAAYEGGRNEATLVINKENPSLETGDLGYKTDFCIYLCDSRERDIWLGVVYGYKALLQVGAIFLAFGTRKVTIKGLNDSQYIAAAIYVTSLFLTAIIVLSVTVNDFVNLYAGLIGGGILITTTAILGLVFVPKMIGLYKDPEGEHIFEGPSDTATYAQERKHSSAAIVELLSSDREKVEWLTLRVQELEKELSLTQGGSSRLNLTYRTKASDSGTGSMKTNPFPTVTETEMATES